MCKWMLKWIMLPVLYSLYFHVTLIMGNASFACNDMTPEQLALSVNCSSPERYTRSYDYMEGGDIRVRKLYCQTGWYLKIDKKGKVRGTTEQENKFSILEIRTVAVGIVAIKGVKSEFFLAMNMQGQLFGKKVCNEDCNFKEMIQENHYNTYASANWTHNGTAMYVALNAKGAPINGKRTKRGKKSAHFLPLPLLPNTDQKATNSSTRVV